MHSAHYTRIELPIATDPPWRYGVILTAPSLNVILGPSLAMGVATSQV